MSDEPKNIDRTALIELAGEIYVGLATAAEPSVGHDVERREELAGIAFVYARTFLKFTEENYPKPKPYVGMLGSAL